MLNSLTFLAFPAFLIISISTKSAPKCESLNFRRNTKCLFKEIVLANDIVVSNLSDKQVLEKLHSSCESLKRCYETMPCQNPEVIQKVNKLKLVSESFTFLSENFLVCSQKIENMRGKCKPRTTCDNMFGDNNCAKEGIINKCSKDEWIGFRDSMIWIMSLVDPHCSLERYRKI
ncbi:Protein CBG26917 [Caenorhabditis briggsae]|uniref:T20D4.11-like domain-containing protein n=2 Tax=Caenorhabditis briggsae TaxID=6238 RepID=A0AAE8ZZ20_CAEBR|nr:Protein CBG26917 [Caenorhabditis briggsae]ULT86399.1 hypothetical protein L3Y34_006232 [Caenorhabditis briggsae]CAR98390.1 Protein CBG26917 [Caenorhabditis briggsae]